MDLSIRHQIWFNLRIAITTHEYQMVTLYERRAMSDEWHTFVRCLYTLHCIHWSVYSDLETADTLCSYIVHIKITAMCIQLSKCITLKRHRLTKT